MLPERLPVRASGFSRWSQLRFRVTIVVMRRTVVIVDDHSQFRRSARKLLELEGFAVIGEAGDGASGVATVERLRPDLVLLDVALPDASGLDLVPALSAIADVVLVSSRDASDYNGLIQTSHARGFISKADLSGETLRALLA